MDNGLKFTHRLLKLCFFFNLAILGGCGVSFTDLSVPDTIVIDTPFEIEVTQTFDGSGITSFLGLDESSFVFAAIIPQEWSALPGGAYEGVFNGVPFTRNANIIPGPPDSNFLDLVESGDISGDFPPELIGAFCDETPPEIPPGQQLVWYQTDQMLPLDTILPTDTAVLTVSFVSDSGADTQELAFQHAIYIEGIVDIDTPVDLETCFWVIDPTNSSPTFVPDMISDIIADVSDGATPIPILGGAMLILLSVMLAGIGLVKGRKWQQR